MMLTMTTQSDEFPKALHMPWVDAVRGVGIVLVVVGHALADLNSEWARSVHSAIYLFHMPLFFILVGFVARPRSSSSSAKHRLLSLMIPYFSYLVLIGVPVAIASHSAHNRPAWKEFLFFLYGGQHLVTWMAVFWFVPCLAAAQILFNAIINQRSVLARLLIILLCYAGAYAMAYISYPMPLGLLTVPMATVFIFSGYELRRHFVLLTDNFAASMLTFGICVGLCVAYSLLISPIQVDMKIGLYGPPIIGFVTSASLVALVLLVAVHSEVFAIRSGLDLLGRASLTIMFLSEPVRRLLIGSIGFAPSVLFGVVIPTCLHILMMKYKLTRGLFLGKLSLISEKRLSS